MALNPIVQAALDAIKGGSLKIESVEEFANTAKIHLPEGNILKIQLKTPKEEKKAE